MPMLAAQKQSLTSSQLKTSGNGGSGFGMQSGFRIQEQLPLDVNIGMSKIMNAGDGAFKNKMNDIEKLIDDEQSFDTKSEAFGRTVQTVRNHHGKKK